VVEHFIDTGEYWDSRFKSEGRIWGEQPSKTAYLALALFRKQEVKKVLVPGSGYGRNTKLFATSGFNVTGVEISLIACGMAGTFDPLTRVVNNSVLELTDDTEIYDAVYCFNVMHLFREEQRKQFIGQCLKKTKVNGLLFFTVFSEKEESFGKGRKVEWNTFESKPSRPVHYFTADDLRSHFSGTEIIDTGLIDDPEDHGEGPHIHRLRYIYLRVNKNEI
jgi:SAM-dependent methyltransferase